MTTQEIHQSRNFTVIAAASFAALGLTAVGCLGAPEDATGVASQSASASNGLAPNALTANALTANALTANALTANALMSNALTSNALTASALEDPLVRELLTYVVSCALPEGEGIALTIHGVDYVFQGSLGLAASWGRPGGSCGPQCRSWVSACVLSRVDFLGVHVELSIRGARRELAATGAERLAYPHREATYWGDIFAAPQIRRACLSPGELEIPRVCGPSTDGCVMDVVGSCDEVCEGVRADGAFVGCGREHGEHGERGNRADVTVFLQSPTGDP